MLHFLDNFLSFKHYNLLISNFLELNFSLPGSSISKRESIFKVFPRMLGFAYFTKIEGLTHGTDSD